MPNYSFRNKKTGRIINKDMKMSEREDYLKNNPHLEQTFTKVSVVDPVGIGVTKPDAAFRKYVLGRVKEKVGGTNIVGERRWDIPKEF